MARRKRASQTRQAAQGGSRPTIAYLTPALDGICEPVWLGIVDAARKHEANLVCFNGAALRTPGVASHANIVFDMVTTENVDGVITWASMLGNHVSADELQAFHQRLLPLPVVTMGKTLEGFPSVLMDSYEGMCEAIVHLIEVHGCRRLAFIRGPEGHTYAQERYRAYVETLKAHGISLNPDLVTPPAPWGRSSGAEAIHLLLVERNLRPQTDIEAIVSVSEDVLIGALEALRAHGVHVPGDVAVVGFDDTVLSRIQAPPLTSVASPLYESGCRAAELLLALMEGGTVPAETIVPSRLMIRQSCGCLDPVVEQAAAGVVKRGRKKLETALRTSRDEFVAAMVQAVGATGQAASWAGQLVDGFAAEIADGSSGSFLMALESVLDQMVLVQEKTATDVGQDPVGLSERGVAVWQVAVSALRRLVLPYMDEELRQRGEDLWQQARVEIALAMQRVPARQALRLGRSKHALRDLEAALITTFDMGELMDSLTDELPRLGVPACYLSLYESPAPYGYPQPVPKWSRLILAWDGGRRVGPGSDERRFLTRRWIPEGILPEGRWYGFVMDALHFQENQLGFVLFEVGPRHAEVYEALREALSSALYGALLLQGRQRAEAALEKAYAEVEQQVIERTAELEREIEQREHIQKESAALQQEVIEAQQRAIQELSTPIIPVFEGVFVMPLIGSVDTLRAKDITRRLLAGIREHKARIVILDITGVPVIDSGVAAHLNKTIQAAQLKGARTVVTGVSDSVAETIVDLGLDWGDIETMSDLRTGLRAAFTGLRGWNLR